MAQTQIFDEDRARKVIDIYRQQGRIAALKEVREMVLFMSDNYLDPKRTDTLSSVLRQIDAMIAKEK